MGNTDGYVIIGTKLDTSGFEDGLDDIKEEADDVDLDIGTGKSEKGLKAINLIVTKISAKVLGISTQASRVLVSVAGALTKLGLIGGVIALIVGAIIIIGKEVFNVLKGNEKFQASMEKIKQTTSELISILAQALQPVIMGLADLIVDLAHGLAVMLSYLVSIAKVFFGLKSYADGTDASLSSSAKSSKEIKKNLAGFDEMNVISSATGGAGAGAGGVSPVLGLEIDEAKIQANVEKAKEYFDKIIKFWEKDVNDLIFNIDGNWGTFVGGLLLSLKGVYDFFKGIIEAVIGIVEMLVGAFTFNTDTITKGWNKMCEGLFHVFGGTFEAIIGILMTTVGLIKGVLLEVWNLAVKTAQDAYNGIKNIFSGFVSFFKNIFTDAWASVKGVFSKGGQIFDGITDGILGGFKSTVNVLIDGINKVVKIPFDGINSALKTVRDIDILGSKPFKGLIKTISVPTLPRLAKGGILSMPGRGINYGMANVAEHGREGVIPLTDSQQMALLGEAIGRYITVNASITNTMNGRVISRELQKIQNESDFAFNR